MDKEIYLSIILLIFHIFLNPATLWCDFFLIFPVVFSYIYEIELNEFCQYSITLLTWLYEKLQTWLYIIYFDPSGFVCDINVFVYRHKALPLCTLTWPCCPLISKCCYACSSLWCPCPHTLMPCRIVNSSQAPMQCKLAHNAHKAA